MAEIREEATRDTTERLVAYATAPPPIKKRQHMTAGIDRSASILSF